MLLNTSVIIGKSSESNVGIQLNIDDLVLVEGELTTRL